MTRPALVSLSGACVEVKAPKSAPGSPPRNGSVSRLRSEMVLASKRWVLVTLKTSQRNWSWCPSQGSRNCLVRPASSVMKPSPRRTLRSPTGVVTSSLPNS